MAADAWESPAGTADAPLVPARRGQRLVGFSCREAVAAAAAAAFVLRHGQSAGGRPLLYVNLAADESVRDWYGPQGINCPQGVYVDRESGTTEVVVYVAGPEGP